MTGVSDIPKPAVEEAKPQWPTVGDLIEYLKGCDPALPVMVDGYEDGYDYISRIGVRGVAFDGTNEVEWWGGQFRDSKEPTLQVLVLGRP